MIVASLPLRVCPHVSVSPGHPLERLLRELRQGSPSDALEGDKALLTAFFFAEVLSGEEGVRQEDGAELAILGCHANCHQP